MELIQGLVHILQAVVEGCFLSTGQSFPLDELLDFEVGVIDGCDCDVERGLDDVLEGGKGSGQRWRGGEGGEAEVGVAGGAARGAEEGVRGGFRGVGGIITGSGDGGDGGDLRGNEEEREEDEGELLVVVDRGGNPLATV